LKYSRTPAYDIVSGGAAALLAGFIGFLVSEKFGFELADSGDFYYAFMYCVFAAFSIKPLVTVADPSLGFSGALSPKRIFTFYLDLADQLVQTTRTLL
jgi:succinate-acetate transporter protein